MSSSRLQHGRVRFDPSQSPAPTISFPASQGGLVADPDPQRLQTAIRRTRELLLSRQHSDGYWVGELEGDSILESEYVLLLAWLGRESSDIARQCAAYLRQQQTPEGGWALYPGGPIEVSASVKAYFALKLTGDDPDAEHMIRAREAIREAGGAERVNSFTRYYLALLGVISYRQCPAVPPELVLLPRWMPFNIYEMSAWSRTILVPLSLLWAHQPVRPVPEERGIRELFLNSPEQLPVSMGRPEQLDALTRPRWVDWGSLFRLGDRVWKLFETCRVKPFRRFAVREAAQWMIHRLAASDGLGAIFPPIIWSVVALRCLGYEPDSPEVLAQLAELEKLTIREGSPVVAGLPTSVVAGLPTEPHPGTERSPEATGRPAVENTAGSEDPRRTACEGATARLQPCRSSVWDTALTTIALRDAGVPADAPVIRRSVDWLLSKEVRQRGDWSVHHPDTEPGGWFFEFDNAFYPDVDDTIMVTMALARSLPGQRHRDWIASLITAGPKGQTSDAELAAVIAGRTNDAAVAVADIERMTPMLAAIRRGVRWVLALQSKGGGWGAFDADNDRELLTQVPFADHNAMIDPPTADITARVLEMFATLGVTCWRRGQTPSTSNASEDEQGRKRSDPFSGAGHPVIDRAIDFVWREQEPDHCWYGRWGVNYIYGTWQCLVGLTQIGVPPTDARVRYAAAWLKDHQHADGSWGETPRSYDVPELRGEGPATASQTAWAVLGLMAAGEIDSDAVRRGIDWLLGTQNEDGTWSEEFFTGTGFPRVFYLRYHMYRLYFPLMALARYARCTRC